MHTRNPAPACRSPGRGQATARTAPGFTASYLAAASYRVAASPGRFAESDIIVVALRHRPPSHMA
ncbi:hypothetical protein [Nonomuraea endophytica]|uniref:hypothetical protein n=1 Tax=Nonomuraea endophytica TaxID=714136 RepID=UPI0037C98A3F